MATSSVFPLTMDFLVYAEKYNKNTDVFFYPPIFYFLIH